MNNELPATIGRYEYKADKSGIEEIDYAAEAHYYEHTDREHGIAIVRINPDDGYRLSSQRWGDATSGILMDVNMGMYDTLHDAITEAEEVFGSVWGLIERFRLELKHAA